jgi:hypothetical protein
MGWKSRNGRAYYYRSILEGRRIRSEYLGHGDAGELFAEIDRDLRIRRALRAAARSAEAERQRKEARATAGVFHVWKLVIRTALEAAGCYCHRRSDWRRRMGQLATVATPGPKRPLSVPADEIRDVLDRARNGDQSTVATLRKWLAEAPEHTIELCGGALAEITLRAIAKRMCPTDLAGYESMRHQVRTLSNEVAGPDPTPLERLLAEQIALAWLDVHFLTVGHHQGVERGKLGSVAALRDTKMIDAAQRRYLQAIKTLAQVRKLNVSVLQVNLLANGAAAEFSG